MLLKTPGIREKLSSLGEIAIKSSMGAKRGSMYKPVTQTLNDGFEVSLGECDDSSIKKNAAEMINFMNAQSEDLIITSVLVRKRCAKVVLWVTLGDSSRQLDRCLIPKLLAL